MQSQERKLHEKSISLKVAHAYIDDQGSVDLSEYTSIDEDAAALLGSSDESYLYLNGLRDLSDPAAESLSKTRGYLRLDGLTELSERAADAFRNHRGELFLNGLTTVSVRVANSLGSRIAKSTWEELAEDLSAADHDRATIDERYSCAHQIDSLSLDGLTSISDEAAKALCEYKGLLSLNGLESLSATARSHFSHVHRSAELTEIVRRVTVLSDSQEDVDFAAMLARGGVSMSELYFDNLIELSPRAAEQLALVETYVFLNGLTTISDEVAEHLCCCGIGESDTPCELHLQGLTECSDYAYLLLSGRPETYLSDSLRDAKFDCSVNHLTVAQRFLLKPFDTEEISEASTLSVQDAVDLARSKLALPLLGLQELSIEVAEALSRHQGSIFFSESCHISERAQEALSTHIGPVAKGI